jgi:L-threonylcarbamoyladenylate synthase
MNTGNFEASMDSAVAMLEEGGVILYPTDTIWGIGCDATDGDAIARIYRIKKRALKKSMIILVSGQEMIRRYVADPSNKLLDYLAAAHQPTTAIFENATGLPDLLIPEEGTIAIRIVQDDFCRGLIGRLDKPLVSTSANISGEEFPQNFSEIVENIRKGVDYIVPYRQDEPGPGSPSSIIKLGSRGEIESVR